MNTNSEKLTTFAITIGISGILCSFTQGVEGFLSQVVGWPIILGFIGGIAGLIGLTMKSKFIDTFAQTAKVITFIIWVLAGLGFVFGIVGALAMA